ncbi:MAG: hypothetical protein KGI25_09400 [Thaumarchaeota archaeon]|nr:hypothetical protein [Nitrososphaerota archaeon]
MLRLVFYPLLITLALPFLIGHAWGDGNTTTSSALVPMFSPANSRTNIYTDSAYDFSITPPRGWIPVSQGNSSDTALVIFGNENPDNEANFAIYYYQGKPIPDEIWTTPDSQILQMSIAKLFDSSKFTVYQQNIERFSDGFVIQAVASENQTTTKSMPIIEEFSFWLRDGRQYFLVMASSQNGFYQNAADFERAVYTFYVGPAPGDVQIPPWVKNTAKWWASGTVDDQNFLSGIQYLIQKGIIVVPPTNSTSQPQQQIPSWIKNSAAWWAEGQISDDDFVKGIQYLISNGIIKA